VTQVSAPEGGTAGVESTIQAERKRQARLQAEAALRGVALHRLANGRWLACRWKLSRELADSEVDGWLQRMGCAP